MDKYAYILISVFLFIPWITIYLLRKDLRKRMMRASIIGGFAGFLAEFWYCKDYWIPPTLSGRYLFVIEDFLVGFMIIGVSVSIFDFLFTIKHVKEEKNRKKFFGVLFLSGVVALLVLHNRFDFQSIFISTFSFIIFSIIMVFIRKDLIMPCIVSGILMLLIIVPIYSILFNVLFPEFWDSYWLLAKTKYGTTVLGNIPATELLWYFSWGCLGGTAYDFASGNKKITRFSWSNQK